MATSSADFPSVLPAGSPAPPFSLPDVSTQVLRALDDLAGTKGMLVVFLCAHCPYVIHVLPKLIELAFEFFPQGISTVGISANDPVAYPEDAPEKLLEMAEAWDLPFPILFDATQEVARAYTAVCTPDFFIFDGERRFVYRGRLDGSTPRNGIEVSGEDLGRAMEAVVSGMPLATPWPPALGCSIKWRK